jgi:hypothetical protein
VRLGVVLSLSLGLFVVPAIGCGKSNPPPQEVPADVASATAAPPVKGDQGHLVKQGNPQFAPDITLPKGTGAPPVKTTEPMPAAKQAALAQIEFAGFKRTVKLDQPGKLVVAHMTASRPHLQVTAIFEPCGGVVLCPKDLDEWRSKGSDVLEEFVAAPLRGSDLTFELEAVTMNNTPVVGSYQLNLHSGIDANGNPYGTATNAYVTRYNDGVNSVTVVAEYRDDLPRTVAGLGGYAPRATLKEMATRFIDFYTQNW